MALCFILTLLLYQVWTYCIIVDTTEKTEGKRAVARATIARTCALPCSKVLTGTQPLFTSCLLL